MVWGGILWAVIFHRKRGDQLPQQVRYNLPIEILYTVLPFIMVGVIFYFTARDENYITKLPHPAVVVDVTGFQWSWQFQYPHYHVTPPGGPTSVVTENGAMWNPGAATQNLPQLVIPENEPVQFNLTSIDVIHAFWVVPFEFKRDVIPGSPNNSTSRRSRTRQLHRPLHGAMRRLPQPYAVPDQDRHARPVPAVDPRAAAAAEQLRGCSVTAVKPMEQAQLPPEAPGGYRKGSILADWLSSTDHKIIGHLYLITSFAFFLFGGVMALIMRAQLAEPAASSCPTSSTTSCSPCTARSCCCCSRRRCSSGSPTRSCRCRSARRTWRSRG